MTLAIHALCTRLPESSEHTSLLGTIVHGANYHLYEPAGNHSRVPTVRRGVTRMYSTAYSTPAAAADERTADLASTAVSHLVEGAPMSRQAVSSVMHSQCSLDQQILGSGCLRVQHDHFPEARAAMTIGQLGTAGLPTALRLLSLPSAQGELTCLSASDKWVAPFLRRVPGLVSYADAAAACLVGMAPSGSEPIAIVLDVVTACAPPEADLWRTPGPDQRNALFASVLQLAERLLERHPLLPRQEILLAGDGYGAAFSAALGEATGLPVLHQPLSDVHLSSASLLFALDAVLEQVHAQGQARHALLWTASPSGHAGAVLVQVRAGARRTAQGWFAAGIDTDATPLMQ